MNEPSSITDNPYDEEEFFQYYEMMRSQSINLNDCVVDPFIDSALAELVEGKTIVDLGCGTGGLAKRLAREAERVTGIDISAKMLEHARCQQPRNCEFIQSDMSDFAMAPQSVDVVVSVMALHYVARIGQVLHEVGRILKPGGTLVFTIEHPIFTAGKPGWVKDENESLFYGLTRYRSDRTIMRCQSGIAFPIYHRSTESYVGYLTDAGIGNLRFFALSYDEVSSVQAGMPLDINEVPIVLGVVGVKIAGLATDG